MTEDRLPPGLYIVATPIGNLGDLSPRAANTLRGADLVLAEDKRVTAKLLSHTGARTRLANYNDHTSEAERNAIVARLGSEAIALVSDAGTPLISDPGYKLVRAAREAGHDVHTVPGPSAVIAALTLAGLPTDRFLFAGFLPSKAKARTDAIEEVSTIRATLVFFESGPRLADAIAALREGLGDREAAVVREISKLHEETVTGSLADLVERYADKPPKGEIVIVVGPPPERSEASDEELDLALDEALRTQSPSRAAAEVASLLNVPKKRAYARALERSK
ncbi:16S rRNA (cytidine(1402)-2'-O)-methyltransferase [Sphingomonas daechungensis]|uniref:Ribosomal RNA small subunit methyltransferase I n=1 Tax=Sphingomonas daechungensis TaxID=1176646 RepID=A0ABX6T391_9SPHN|nr:16S rRNA (cytidine(1402)-2'-O)-methyltransferase [Sphingomonas daechungensis]QNP43362.1 16S rRNA (cytidine(1402)-2'-O)-methyltransferase [Sphingomonas daechungensis]